ncbi:MAG: hypothetical protein H7A31_00425 [Thermotogae bacterium]|nr:hypothetical protein [Thermotogota bacterium]MCP5465143.1 hypothetical protein [Thermotogota bacterium]HOO74920.1 PC4/YdbC family ssDNA-binding protein [Tepiditoga sp.]
MSEIKYEIVDNYGVLSQSAKGWTKEVKSIKWNDRPAKIDIREWSPDGEKMGKGITLSFEEAATLRDILNKLDI